MQCCILNCTNCPAHHGSPNLHHNYPILTLPLTHPPLKKSKPIHVHPGPPSAPDNIQHDLSPNLTHLPKLIPTKNRTIEHKLTPLHAVHPEYLLYNNSMD
jgi:hypothetical protein